MRILCVIKNFTNEAKAILKQVGETDYFDLNQSELTDKIKDYNVLLVGLGLNIDKEMIEKAGKLKVIATATTGLDHIDTVYAEKKGVKVLSLRGEKKFLNNITGTAELAFGLLIDVMRGISVSFESVKNNKWQREKFRGHCLRGKTLGIVGYGRLGRKMASYGRAFGMRVMINDPYVKTKKSGLVGFNDLIKNSDVISLHLHLDQKTMRLFNSSVFKKMKKCAFLVNTSRGEIVDEVDLLKALKTGVIAGYATDVLAGELSFRDSFSNYSLVEYAKENKNCVITPHIGGMTHESRKATDSFIVKRLIDWCEKRNFEI